MKVTVRRKWTFSQRFRREALFFGIPMFCFELIGVPAFGWATVLLLAVPAALVALLATTTIEHLLISAISKGNEAEQ